MSVTATTQLTQPALQAEVASRRLDWIEPLKALALIGILWNHIAECFGRGPWFTNPTPNWQPFAERMAKVYPFETQFPWSITQFVGWLGDSCPGVFILLSGFGLTWAALGKRPDAVGFLSFFRRRTARIFPLYIAMHFVILGLAVAVPGNTLDLGERRTLLSLLGLRFTDDLFFKISPSWWFVWTILQLYVLFPILYGGLRRFGLARFLAVTCGLTFAVRLAALFGVPSQWNLYYWMTGVFCGTRLAEFTVGMALAAHLHRIHAGESKPRPTSRLLFVSLACYATGFACSLTWYGTVVSNLMVSVGLTGLFFSAWKTLLSRNASVAAGLTWIGVESFSVFLLHQPPMKWSIDLLADEPFAVRFAAVLGVTLASFPIGRCIRRFVDRLMGKLQSLATNEQRSHWMLRMGTTAGCLTIGLAMFLLNPTPSPHWEGRGFSVLIGIVGAMAAMCDWALTCRTRPHAIAHGVYRSTFAASFLHLFVFPSGHGSASLAVGMLFGVASVGVDFVLRRLASDSAPHRLFGLRRLLSSPMTRWAAGATASILLFAVAEASLIKWHPIETNRWGEFPALMSHPTRGYALKPNLNIRLHYNNYDYRLKTNSLGLASPEVPIEKPKGVYRVLVLGDAFSMPEGFTNGWTRGLESLVNSDGRRPGGVPKIQVINGGVTGYGPNESLAQYAELAPLLKPDITIYQFFANEFFEAGQDFQTRRIGIGLEAGDASKIERLIGRSQVISHINRYVTEAKERVRDEPSSYRRSRALLKLFPAGPDDMYSDERLAHVESALSEMKQIARRCGSTFDVCYVPAAINVLNPSEMSYFPKRELTERGSLYDFDRPRRHLSAVSERVGISVYDMSSWLKDRTPDRWAGVSLQPTYFRDSWHWNEHGHAVMSRFWADYLTWNVLPSADPNYSPFGF